MLTTEGTDLAAKLEHYAERARKEEEERLGAIRSARTREGIPELLRAKSVSWRCVLCPPLYCPC